MFVVGKRYTTVGGPQVLIVEELGIGTPHRCVKGDDGIWRYNREGSMGFVTGQVSEKHPANLLAESPGG